jgi:hypothetical protein
MTEKKFNGVINLDVRDSVADWAPYTPVKAQVVDVSEEVYIDLEMEAAGAFARD